MTNEYIPDQEAVERERIARELYRASKKAGEDWEITGHDSELIISGMDWMIAKSNPLVLHNDADTYEADCELVRQKAEQGNFCAQYIIQAASFAKDYRYAHGWVTN